MKNHETISCIYEDCDFASNVYGRPTFKSHKSRTHYSSTLQDLKIGIVIRTAYTPEDNSVEPTSSLEDDAHHIGDDDVCDAEVDDEEVDDEEDLETLPQDIERTIAALLLKLENVYHVSSTAINELVKELEFIACSISLPVIQNIIIAILQKHKCNVDQPVITEIG